MDKENFFIRLKNEREKLGISQKALAAKTGVSITSVQNWEKDTYPKGDALVQLADMLNCSIDWLLTGRGVKSLENINGSMLREVSAEYRTASNVVDLKHADVIKKFKDKDYALNINADLVDLETLNPHLYKEAGSYIKGLAQGVRASQIDRRHTHRRSHDDQSAIPEEGDRRQGKNRRAVNGN